jgi:uncharacterized membrane protein
MKGITIVGIIMMVAAIAAIIMSFWGIQTEQANYFSFMTPIGLFMIAGICITSGMAKPKETF